jgi:hypothetical protein
MPIVRQELAMTMKDQPQGNVIYCPSCGQPSQPSANYCRYCGALLADAVPKPSQPAANYCPHCGTRLAVDVPKPGLALAGLVCSKCKIQNRPGIVDCEFCGTNLLTGQATFAVDKDAVGSDEPEVLETKKVTEYQNKITRRGKADFDTRTFLSLQIEDAPHPLTLRIQPKRPLMFGRSRSTADEFVIDLSPYGAHDKGVSRRHAAIEREGNSLFLWDLTSSNGTYLNGIRLTPLQLHQVHDGDEICLGRLILRIYFQTPASDE